MSYGEKRLLVEFDLNFGEMEKGVGVEFVSYQPFVLWPNEFNHKVRTTFYMAVYGADNWRFKPETRATGMHRIQVEKHKFKTSLMTESDKKTDFLIPPSESSATYFAYSCNPPGARNHYDGESWYKLNPSLDGMGSHEVLFTEDLSDMVVIKR